MTTISVLDSTGATQTVAKVVATGSTTSANSLPVVIASDQAAVPVSAATLPLPTGAATAAGVAAIVTALGTPAQAGGAVTVAGVATAANQTSGAQLLQLVSSTAQATAGISAQVDVLGQQNVNPPFALVFTDPFDGAVVDTTNRWTVTTGGTGSVTQGSGQLSVNSGTTALGFAAIVSKATFAPKNVSLDVCGFTLVLETPLLANLTRFYGKGTVPATPTAAVPITDGFGFLLTSTTMQLVVYASGALVGSPVTLPLPANNAQHIYAVVYRADTIVAIVDNLVIPAGVTISQPGVQTLPIAMVAIAGASGPAAGQQMQFNLVALGDSGHNANQLADGTYPWINGTIKQASTAPLATDTALVVTESPNSPTFVDLLITGQGVQTASGNNILLSTAGTGPSDANGYRTIAIEVVPTGTVSSGVVTFEASNDQVNYVPLSMFDANAPTTAPVTTISPATGVIRYMVGNTLFRYVRARISTVIGGGGSLQAFARLSQTALAGPVSGTVIVGSGTVTTVTTVTTVSTLTTLANGQTAHSAASTGSPVRIGGRVNTAVDTTLVAGDASDLFMTTSGAAVNKPYAAPEVDWQVTSGAAAFTATGSTVLKAAGAAGVRNYLTALQVCNTSTTLSVIVTILDGAAVIWATQLPPNATTLPVTPTVIDFPTPLRGTAATAMNIQFAAATVAAFYNVQGYQAP